MTRIEKIRQMPDEELAEFLSKVAELNDGPDVLLQPDYVRNMPDHELAGYLCALDHLDTLKTCNGGYCPAGFSGGGSHCVECFLRWLREEGSLMDGEG